MLFSSLDFALFLPIVFFLYWLFYGNRRFQNLIILVASYIFYGWWNWKFLFLIFLSTVIDYFIAIGIFSMNLDSKRKVLLLLSFTFNLGTLFFFKYYNYSIKILKVSNIWLKFDDFS